MLMQYAICILSVRSMPMMFQSSDESINPDFYELLLEEENDLLNAPPTHQYGQLSSNGGKCFWLEALKFHQRHIKSFSCQYELC